MDTELHQWLRCRFSLHKLEASAWTNEAVEFGHGHLEFRPPHSLLAIGTDTRLRPIEKNLSSIGSKVNLT